MVEPFNNSTCLFHVCVRQNLVFKLIFKAWCTISTFRAAIKNKFFHSYIFNHLDKQKFVLQFFFEDYFFSSSVFFHKSVFQKKCNSC